MGREELSYYGAIVADYEGHGCLTLENGWRWNCTFEAGQLSDGKALLICHISLDGVPISQRSRLHLVDSATSFEGETEKYSIIATEGFRVLNKLFDTKVTPANYVVAYFMRKFELKTKLKGESDATNAKTVHFGITNFEITEIKPKLIYKSGSMAEKAITYSISEDHQPDALNLDLKNERIPIYPCCCDSFFKNRVFFAFITSNIL